MKIKERHARNKSSHRMEGKYNIYIKKKTIYSSPYRINRMRTKWNKMYKQLSRVKKKLHYKLSQKCE